MMWSRIQTTRSISEESILDDAAFYFHRTVWGQIRSQKDTAGNYVLPYAGWVPDQDVLAQLVGGGPVRPAGKMGGRDVYTNRWLPALSASTTSLVFGICGNMKALAFGDLAKCPSRYLPPAHSVERKSRWQTSAVSSTASGSHLSLFFRALSRRSRPLRPSSKHLAKVRASSAGLCGGASSANQLTSPLLWQKYATSSLPVKPVPCSVLDHRGRGYGGIGTDVAAQFVREER